jgi:hypothetical protein
MSRKTIYMLALYLFNYLCILIKFDDNIVKDYFILLLKSIYLILNIEVKSLNFKYKLKLSLLI